MGPFAFLNQQFLPVSEAKLSPLDRGFLFGDGVYESIPVHYGTPFLLERHLQRLNESLHFTHILNPYSLPAWKEHLFQLIQHNADQGPHQTLYVQVTRGMAPVRSHVPQGPLTPSVFATTFPFAPFSKEERIQGVKAVTLEDIRWHHCEVKTVALMGNVLLKQEADRKGAFDAILIRNGIVTEGTCSNVFIVRKGEMYTAPKSPWILSGITRDFICELAKMNLIPLQEKAFSKAVLYEAEEIWFTGSTRGIIPITQIDGIPVGEGKAGPVWHKIFTVYENHIQSLCNPAQAEVA